jgi:hypothetical protein
MGGINAVLDPHPMHQTRVPILRQDALRVTQFPHTEAPSRVAHLALRLWRERNPVGAAGLLLIRWLLIFKPP